MSDDKSKTGAQDRRTVAGAQSYEVTHFAAKHGLTIDQVHELIKKFGNGRAILDAEAEKVKLDRLSSSPISL